MTPLLPYIICILQRFINSRLNCCHNPMQINNIPFLSLFSKAYIHKIFEKIFFGWLILPGPSDAATLTTPCRSIKLAQPP